MQTYLSKTKVISNKEKNLSPKLNLLSRKSKATVSNSSNLTMVTPRCKTSPVLPTLQALQINLSDFNSMLLTRKEVGLKRNVNLKLSMK